MAARYPTVRSFLILSDDLPGKSNQGYAVGCKLDKQPFRGIGVDRHRIFGPYEVKCIRMLSRRSAFRPHADLQAARKGRGPLVGDLLRPAKTCPFCAFSADERAQKRAFRSYDVLFFLTRRAGRARGG